MNDIEAEAHKYLLHREWLSALELFDRLLNHALVKSAPKERVVTYLLGRSECFLALGRHEAVVSDCRKIIKLLGGVNGVTSSGARAWRRLVHALFTLQRFNEAEAAATEWIATYGQNPEAAKMLEHVRVVLRMSNSKCSLNDLNYQLTNGGEEMVFQDAYRDPRHAQSLDEMKKPRKHPVKLIESNDNGFNLLNSHPPHGIQQMSRSSQPPTKHLNHQIQQQIDQVTAMRISDKEAGLPFSCIYCGLTFGGRNELKAHCQTEEHQTIIMSDEGRDWKWRPPPRGHMADNYTLCENWIELGSCRFGAQCVEAHGADELREWRERFEYRRMKLQRACEKELYGKSYTELLLDRWSQSAQPTEVMKDSLDGVEVSCDSPLSSTTSSKINDNTWTFTINTVHKLKAVALLQDNHRNHFYIRRVLSTINNEEVLEYHLNNKQEWTGEPPSCLEPEGEKTFCHSVEVSFVTDIFGTFRQSVVFDVGLTTVIVKHLCVDVIPVTDADKMKELKKELVLSSMERWDKENSVIVNYTSPICDVSLAELEREKELLAAYPPPRPENFTLTQGTVSEKRPTRNNYRARMHELLFVEEMARFELVANYNVQARLQIAKNYLLSPSGVAASTAKYAHNGELFALLSLGKNVSEDTSAGRLILSNCTTVLLSPVLNKHEMKDKKEDKDKRIVYEALIEDKGKSVVYLRLSSAIVQALNLKPETKAVMDVQFQLNRVPYCEWHQAIDKIADFRMIFPETYVEPTIPWSPQRQWSGSLEARLNPKQREAVMAITTPLEVQLPPILIIGPFGTGKTYTLAQAIKEVLKQPGTRVLVCTHSNSAADLYIKDYLHPYVEAGHEEARPLRIFYHRRWVATVNHIVQKYAMIETNDQGVRSFKIPKVEDILKHRVIVVTLSISMYLSTLGLKKGHFTHILLDEAAQAMECEAIMPLALANDSTRIVLAGDHMQLSPELFSEFAKERNLHISLLERLYDHYPSSFPCKILLCENYRAHEAIIQFTSELFYEQKLVSSGKQPRHDHFYPLTFFTTRGEDVQDQNSTAFYNNSEVYEVVERVCELKKRWPTSWGKLDEQSIGIMTPYSDQVFRIRSELRKRRLGGISVERVLNVQGKQFRAIFLSTVRTRRTCDTKTGADMEYGFLSNSKLLNTAITRAQSLVAVVGDPVALCSVGRCRKVWERFIEICNNNNSLFGIKWSYLRSQLDGVELKKMYTLNPLAPEFIPRQFQMDPGGYLMNPIIPYTMPPPLRFPPTVIPPPPPPIIPYPIYYPPLPNGFIHIPQVLPPPPPVNGTPPVNPWLPPYPPMGPPPPTPSNSLIVPPPPPPTNFIVKKEAPPPVQPPSVRRDDHLRAPPPGIPFRQPPPLVSPIKDPPWDRFATAPSFHPPTSYFIRPPGPPAPLAIHKPVDRQRDIQFLHNVHFPERHTMGPLLPQDVALEDLLDSQPKQVQWYNFLLNSYGFDAATKFAEYLGNAPRKPTLNHILPLSVNGNDLCMNKVLPKQYAATLSNSSNHESSITLSEVTEGKLMSWFESQPKSSSILVDLDLLVPTTSTSGTEEHHRNGSVPLYQRQPGMSSSHRSDESSNGGGTTYANILKAPREEPSSASPIHSVKSPTDSNDLLTGLRDLGNKAFGVYQYFS